MRIGGPTTTGRPPRSRGRRGVTRIVAMSGLLMTVGCVSTYRSMTAEEKRAYLLELEETTLAEIVEQHPEAQADLDNAVGYAIFSNTATKIPLVGAGDGIGVVVDARSGRRTYLRVGRLDVGGGLGVRTFRVIAIFFDEMAFSKLATGKLELGAGVEAAAGTEDIGTGAGGVAGVRNDKRVLYQLSEAGVSATFTVRLIRYKVLDLDEP